MKCQNQGYIQAYLDGELSREERKEFSFHLEQCSECQMKLEEENKLENWTHLAIDESMKSPLNDIEIDTDTAWQRFENQLHASKNAPKTSTSQPKREKRSQNKMGKYKKWFVGTAAAVVIAGSLTLPQVQATAGEFLSIFRVDKFELVKLTQSDLQEIESWIGSNGTGEMNIKGIGSLRIDDEDNRQQYYFETAEAAAKEGYKIPKLPEGYNINGISISPEFNLSATLDTDKANKLLSQLNAETSFDNELDGKEFSIKIPQSINTHFTIEGESNLKNISYLKSESPEMTVPEGVNVNELRTSILSLPFIPENVKQQLASINDWQRTLPIPVVEQGAERVSKATVQGEEAIVYEGEYDTYVIWQKDGMLHHLRTYSEGKNIKDELISLANQIN